MKSYYFLNNERKSYNYFINNISKETDTYSGLLNDQGQYGELLDKVEKNKESN